MKRLLLRSSEHLAIERPRLENGIWDTVPKGSTFRLIRGSTTGWVPYSHNQGPCMNLTCFPPATPCFGTCDVGIVPLPLMSGTHILEQPPDLTLLTPRYNEAAVDFMRKQSRAGQPFLLYYASHHTHYPQFASAAFTNASQRGPFGDALLEFDHSVGLILNTLRTLGIENNTLVFFTSDNGCGSFFYFCLCPCVIHPLAFSLFFSFFVLHFQDEFCKKLST
uniref:Sulfatase N-terminal domain-containing protein n=2 Tax=Eptatretus burgeri TaxID=7764 RepID=A0A8C4QD23_EPTBU